MLLTSSSPSLVDRWSVVDGEMVPVCVCGVAGEELCEVGDELINTFKLISVDVVAAEGA